VINNDLILRRFFAKYKAHVADYDAFKAAFDDAFADAVDSGYTGTFGEWLEAIATSSSGWNVYGGNIYIQPTAPTNPNVGDVWYNTQFLEESQ